MTRPELAQRALTRAPNDGPTHAPHRAPGSTPSCTPRHAPRLAPRSTLRSALLAATATLVLGACNAVPHRPEVARAIDAIDEARLRAHVEALCHIGPRPMEDADATARTVAWLREQLTDLGLTPREEPVRHSSQAAELVAKLTRSDAAGDVEQREFALPGWAWTYGSRVLQGQTARFAAEGWEVQSYAVRFAEGGGGMVESVAPNLLVEFPGRSGLPGVVELSAHYDTVPFSPGADDNSSGVAALLEIARVLTQRPPERSVRLCFFAGEEQGLLGSAVHVAAIQERGEQVLGLFNLDSVGYASRASDSQQAPVRILFVTWMPSTGDFITVIGDWSSGPLGNLFEDAVDTYVPELPYYSANRIGGWFEDGRRSDHAPYWDAGIPALFLTDTGEFRTDTYHQPSDLPGRLDYAWLRRVTQAATAAALELARR